MATKKHSLIIPSFIVHTKYVVDNNNNNNNIIIIIIIMIIILTLIIMHWYRTQKFKPQKHLGVESSIYRCWYGIHPIAACGKYSIYAVTCKIYDNSKSIVVTCFFYSYIISIHLSVHLFFTRFLHRCSRGANVAFEITPLYVQLMHDFTVL